MPFIRIQTLSSVSSVIQEFDLSHSLILSEFRTFSDFRQFFEFSQSVQCEQFVSRLNSLSKPSMDIHRVRQGFCWVHSAILMTSAIQPVRALISVTEQQSVSHWCPAGVWYNMSHYMRYEGRRDSYSKPRHTSRLLSAHCIHKYLIRITTWRLQFVSQPSQPFQYNIISIRNNTTVNTG